PTPADNCRLTALATPALAPNEIPAEAPAEMPAPAPIDNPTPPPIDSPAPPPIDSPAPPPIEAEAENAAAAFNWIPAFTWSAAPPVDRRLSRPLSAPSCRAAEGSPPFVAADVTLSPA